MWPTNVPSFSLESEAEHNLSQESLHAGNEKDKDSIITSSLHLSNRAGGWSPLTSDRYQWLQVDLGERTKITAVATQGRYGSSDWLTSYLLMFSDTGHNWKQYRQEDSIGSFPGNSNADSVVQYKLQQPTIARLLRLLPLDWNPSGRIGLRLETYGCPYTSDVVSLDGSSSSSLVYRLSPAPKQTSKEVISLKFKTLRNSGTLLHAKGQGGLSLSLELERGKLPLVWIKVSGGSSPSEARRLASLGSLLDDQHWHHVTVERRNVHLNLTVDKHTERVQIPAESLPHEVTPTRPLQLINIHVSCCFIPSLTSSLHSASLHASQGNVTFSCAESVSVAVTFPGPQSFLQLPGATASSSEGMAIRFQFRTWNKAGLLLTFGLPHKGGGVWLYLSQAGLRLQVHKDGRSALELSAGSALSDGQWHSVELTLGQGRLTVAVDKKEGGIAHASPSFPVTVGGPLFFGAVYEQSCEAYKHNGNTSGHFYIDVDGSGPIRPQLVYCNMTEENTWMVIQHNNTELTRVRPSPGVNQHIVHFDYSSQEEQLSAVTSQSQHCEQELSYQCRKSRLLNTPGETQSFLEELPFLPVSHRESHSPSWVSFCQIGIQTGNFTCCFKM
uniref:Contactin associated protein like 3 n=1 Tax=Echeneis naucrates TaxID=173247 RepID=A0A665XFZ8_ECHNA